MDNFTIALTVLFDALYLLLAFTTCIVSLIMLGYGIFKKEMNDNSGTCGIGVILAIIFYIMIHVHLLVMTGNFS